MTTNPVACTLVEFLALFGDTFWDKGTTTKYPMQKTYHPGDGPPLNYTKLGQPPFVEADFNDEVHQQIRALLAREDVSAVICFEYLELSPTHSGRRAAMVVGPGCTYKTVEEVKDRPIGETPSVQKWAVAYYQKPT